MKATRLSLILNHLHITANELADRIHVHPSLISRWKHGNRRFEPGSAHFENVVGYIMEKDKRTNHQNIQIFLGDYFPGESASSKEEIELLLKKWLSEQNSAAAASDHRASLNSGNIAEACIIKGEHEKKEALLNFLDASLLLPTKKNIYIMIDKNTSLLLDDGWFYAQWIEKLNDTIACGNQVYFIYNNSFGSFICNLKNFFSLCSCKQYHSYAMPQTGYFSEAFNLCIIEDVLALTDFTPSVNSKSPVLFSFTHWEIVSRLQSQYQNYLKSCKPLSTRIISEPNQFHIFLQDRTYLEQNIYIYDETPFLFPLSDHLFRQILEYNAFDASLQDAILEKYNTIVHNSLLPKDPTSGFRRIILNFDMLKVNLKKDQQTYIPNLFSTEQIIIPKKLYPLFIKELLSYLAGWSEENFLKIALTDNSFVGNNAGIMTYSSENLFTYIYSSGVGASMLFTNPTITMDAYHLLDDLWQDIPEEDKNPKAIMLRLKKLFLALV